MSKPVCRSPELSIHARCWKATIASATKPRYQASSGSPRLEQASVRLRELRVACSVPGSGTGR